MDKAERVFFFKEMSTNPGFRRLGRKLVRKGDIIDRLAASMSDRLRVRYEEDGYVTYGIVPGATDANHIADRLVLVNDSPYDCSGAPFTMAINCRVCAAGVSIVHRVRYDV